MKKKFMLFVAGLAFAISGQAYAQLVATLEIDSTLKIANRVAVIVTGRYTCSPVPLESTGLGFANISGTVFQAFRTFVNSAGFFLDLDITAATCDGTQHSFAVSAIGFAPFHGGGARVVATLTEQDCSVSPCVTATANVDQSVRLTP